MSATASLRAALLEQGGALADAAEQSAGGPEAEPGAPRLAASGPRAADREAEYELLLEMILEGSLHSCTTVLSGSCAPRMRIWRCCFGDQLYALGLSRLAGLGDLDAVAELADVISLVAQAHAASDPALVDAVWDAGATAIGWGEHRSRRREAAGARGRRRRGRCAAGGCGPCPGRGGIDDRSPRARQFGLGPGK